MQVKMVELKVMGEPHYSDWLARQLETHFVGLLLHESLAYEMQVQLVSHLFATQNTINHLNSLPIFSAGKTLVVAVAAAEICSARTPFQPKSINRSVNPYQPPLSIAISILKHKHKQIHEHTDVVRTCITSGKLSFSQRYFLNSTFDLYE